MVASLSPASTDKKPIGTLPVTLSATYHDESPMNTSSNPPTLSINGDDQSGAWLHSLTLSDNSSDDNDYWTTVSYTVPTSYGDGKLYTFVITFYDTDKSVGCGAATFYVQSPQATPPATSSCHEDVLDSSAPDSSFSHPITNLSTPLTAVYRDETPMNTSSNPPTLSIDGDAQAGAWPGSLIDVGDSTRPHDYSTTLSYTVPPDKADGTLHTFAITFYDSDHSAGDGCGVATFYVKASTP